MASGWRRCAASAFPREDAAPPGNHTYGFAVNIPEAIESVVWAVDGEDRGPGVGLRHPAISLQHNHLCPNFVVDLVPLVQDLLDVILQQGESGANWAHCRIKSLFSSRCRLKRAIIRSPSPLSQEDLHLFALQHLFTSWLCIVSLVCN